jgi:porin
VIRTAAIAALLAGLLFFPEIASADDAPASGTFLDDLWKQDSLSGDWNGWRDRWVGHGVVLAADSIDELVGNASGGISREVVYSGRFELVATVDLDKLLGWDATLHANIYWTHGRSLTDDALGANIMTVSNIEAVPSVRLFDLWVEQLLFDDRLSVRAGQIAADDEFLGSDTASNFSNSTFGWPAIMGADLTSGGPVYDIATPGIRLKYATASDLSLSLALFNGDPANPGPGDPQRRNNDGLTFRTNGGAFVMAESAYKTSLDLGAGDLPSTFKVGAWFHNDDFGDQHFDNTGRSLASPESTGIPAIRSNNYGAYFIADQIVWQNPDAKDSGVSAFLRVAGTPSDRNLISFYADTGVAFTGLVPERPNDVFGLALAFAQISPAASALDRDVRFLNGTPLPIRDYEATFELTYHLQLNQWWALQPDVQYVIHPAGNVALPGSRDAIPDALILGLRSSIVI